MAAQVELPEKLVQEIDAVVGAEGRSAFLVQTAEAELRRRRLLAFLRNPEPAWKEEDHPELAEGANAWIQRIRSEGERRIPKTESESAEVK